MGNYYIDWKSLEEHFPPEFPAPKLLMDFAKWLDKSKGSLGGPRIWAERMGEWGDYGDELHKIYMPFIRTSCGSLVAFWFPDGRPMKNPPVVLIGSEGEQELLGKTLHDFLTKLAQGKTGDSDLDYRHEGEVDDGPALLAWLKKTKAPAPAKLPKYKTWVTALSKRGREQAEKDPILNHLAEILRKHKPFAKGAAVYDSENYAAVAIGQTYAAWELPEHLNVKTAAAIEPLVRAWRKKRAEACPERGGFLSAQIKVYPDGPARISCEFLQAPEIAGKKVKIPSKDYVADFKQFPRSKYWTPAWLAKMVKAKK